MRNDKGQFVKGHSASPSTQFKKGQGFWTGKKRPPFSEEWKRKISANLDPLAATGHTPWNKGTKGLITPWNKGIKTGLAPWRGKKRSPFSDEWRRRIGEGAKGNKYALGRIPPNKGISPSEETKEKISLSLKGRFVGPNAPRWIADRTKLAKKQERNDPAYQDWRRQVWNRDGFKCKIADQNCNGRIEAHHILSWRDYLELRYQPNNGITLCHHHHPRIHASEMEMVTAFQKLVAEAH